MGDIAKPVAKIALSVGGAILGSALMPGVGTWLGATGGAALGGGLGGMAGSALGDVVTGDKPSLSGTLLAGGLGALGGGLGAGTFGRSGTLGSKIAGGFGLKTPSTVGSSAITAHQQALLDAVGKSTGQVGANVGKEVVKTTADHGLGKLLVAGGVVGAAPVLAKTLLTPKPDRTGQPDQAGLEDLALAYARTPWRNYRAKRYTY